MSSLGEILQLITSGVNLGVLGIVFWLFVGGKLHSDAEYQRCREDLDTERAAHERTREALRLANARADTSALSAQVIAQALGGYRSLDGGIGRAATSPTAQG